MRIVQGQQRQVVFIREMLCKRARKFFGGREVDEAIRNIDRCASSDAVTIKGFKLCFPKDFIDQHTRFMRPLVGGIKLQLHRLFVSAAYHHVMIIVIDPWLGFEQFARGLRLMG